MALAVFLGTQAKQCNLEPTSVWNISDQASSWYARDMGLVQLLKASAARHGAQAMPAQRARPSSLLAKRMMLQPPCLSSRWWTDAKVYTTSIGKCDTHGVSLWLQPCRGLVNTGGAWLLHVVLGTGRKCVIWSTTGAYPERGRTNKHPNVAQHTGAQPWRRAQDGGMPSGQTGRSRAWRALRGRRSVSHGANNSQT
ncbi:unnamed protein product [Polarella glacialis]|uniref:Uncharacterized protein n=1 Tax=Polarella glacialis TaxID=89957 RepID=A0A813FQE1_POLGL|nr:unnamed protein product [Polarella glacialis]